MRWKSVLLLITVLFLVQLECKSSKTSTRTGSAPKPAKPSSAPKKDKSWARSMIDTAKQKFGRSEKKAPKPTQKSLLQRAKENKYVGKAVGFVKKDLGIGVVGPKKPSKILKYGSKAVQKLFTKKRTSSYRSSAAVGSAIGASQLHEKVAYMQSQLERMQETIQADWNTSEAGTKYKAFEEPVNWDDAQLHCEQLGSHLAYLDSESKNLYAYSLLASLNISHAWFGLRTQLGTEPSPEGFTNFSHLNGCGVVNEFGEWSISSCSMQLPFVCQALRLNVLVEIPPSGL